MKPKLISEKEAKIASKNAKRPRLSNLFLGAALALLPLTHSKAQMNSFVFPPNDFKVTSSPVITTPISGMSSNSYFMSTGIRDYSGSLRFYIMDYAVYDGPSNTYIGTLGGVQGTGFSPEITIVPIPGGCHNKFYAFYCMAGYCNGSPGTGDYEVNYVTIDCSVSPATVSAPTQLYYKSNGGGAGLAASKLIGTGASAFHYLYMGEGLHGIYVCKISSSGISTPQNIGFSYSGGTVPKELELSENGEWLAFNSSWNNNGGGGPSSQVSVIKLDPTTYPNQYLNDWQYSYFECEGIEFVGNGQPDLYVCGKGNGGMGANQYPFFDKIDVANQTITNILQQSSFQNSNASGWGGVLNFNNTLIEYSKSGQICGFCNGNGQEYFVEYDVNNQTVYGTAVSGSPNANNSYFLNCNYSSFDGSYSALNGTYYMPDQIDGFDYNTIGLSQSMLYILNINGSPVSSTCGEWTEVYNCNQILLPEKLFDGLPCGSNITISAYDEDCNPVYGSDYFNYSGPLALNDEGYVINRDLKSYKYFNGDREYSFATTPGYYGISIDFIDCCSKQRIHLQAYIHVLGAIPLGINMQMYNFYTAPTISYVGVSHNINSPNLVGTTSLGFYLNGSTGSIAQVNVLVQEVDTTGAVITSNPNGGTIINETDYFANLNILNTVNLNSYCAPGSLFGGPPPTLPCSVNAPAGYNGYKNYFSDHGAALAGKYYKVTVTLGNPCSSASEWTYMKVDTTYPTSRPAAPTGIKEIQVFNSDAKIYPNPAIGEMNISISNNVNDVYTIELFDVLGRKVATLYDQLNIEAGNHNISTNVSAVQNGTYLWKVSSRSFSKSGTICISK